MKRTTGYSSTAPALAVMAIAVLTGVPLAASAAEELSVNPRAVEETTGAELQPASASFVEAMQAKDTPISETPAVDGLGCCGGNCSGSHLIGGADLYLIKPFFSNNPALTFFDQGTGPANRVNISEHAAASPLFWLGFVSDSGMGFRARWWNFYQGTDQSYALTPPSSGATVTGLSAGPLGAFIIQDNPKAFAVTSKLEVNVIDLEVFQNASLCRWNFQVSGGVSLAEIDEAYHAYAIDASGSPVTPLNSKSSFSGVGPVLALEASRPLCGSWGVYSSLRSRVLFGTSRQTAFGGDEVTGVGSSSQQAIVSVEELEMGLQYNRCLGRSTLIGRVGMVGQEWYGANNASGSLFGGPPTSISNFSTQSTSNFGFFGVVFRVGVNF